MNKKAICGICGALFVLDPLPVMEGELSIANSSSSEGSPSVVYNINQRQYAVAYSRVPEVVPGETSLYLHRIPRDGVNRDKVILFFSRVSSAYAHNSAVKEQFAPNATVSWNPQWGVYLVTWDFIVNEDGKTEVYSQRLSLDGPRGTAYTIVDGADFVVRSYHAYNPIEDNYPLVYCDWLESNLLSVHLDSSGDDVSNSSNNVGKCSMTPMLILNSGWGEYLAIWWLQYKASVRVYVNRLDKNGLPIAVGRRISFWHERPMALNFLYGTLPRGAYNPVLNQYLVVWQRGNEVWGRIIEADGTPRAASIRISEGGSPDVVFSVNQNEYIVVHDRAGEIFGALVGPDSNIIRTFQISESKTDKAPTDKAPRIAYDSFEDEALVVWVREAAIGIVPQDNKWNNDIMGRLITSGGALR